MMIYIPTQTLVDDHYGGGPECWQDRDLELFKYMDEFNGIKKLYKRKEAVRFGQSSKV